MDPFSYSDMQRNLTAQDLLRSITGGKDQANAVTSFEKILPFKQYLQNINSRGIAENRINPEEMYRQRQSLNDYANQRGSNGGSRFGSYYTGRGDLYDQLERGRQERISSFTNQLENQYTKQYQMLAEMYWKDPNLDVQNLISPYKTPVQQLPPQNPSLPAQPGQPFQPAVMPNPGNRMGIMPVGDPSMRMPALPGGQPQQPTPGYQWTQPNMGQIRQKPPMNGMPDPNQTNSQYKIPNQYSSTPYRQGPQMGPLGY
jgi:hypothetical protein